MLVVSLMMIMNIRAMLNQDVFGVCNVSLMFFATCRMKWFCWGYHDAGFYIIGLIRLLLIRNWINTIILRLVSIEKCFPGACLSFDIFKNFLKTIGNHLDYTHGMFTGINFQDFFLKSLFCSTTSLLVELASWCIPVSPPSPPQVMQALMRVDRYGGQVMREEERERNWKLIECNFVANVCYTIPAPCVSLFATTCICVCVCVPSIVL